MPWLLNVCYLLTLVLLSPWLAFKAWTTGKYRRGLREKFSGLSSPVANAPGSPPVWFHGVSVGEIHLLRQVVAAFRKRHPGQRVVISTTTDTGHDEARRCFPDLPVIYFPLDFTWAIRRTLNAVKPALIVLAESELWPNFLEQTWRQGVPVAVINGRMSPRSFARWRKLGFLARWLFRRVTLFAVQTDAYTRNLIGLGAAPEIVHATGSVKYDGVTSDRHNPRTEELRRLFAISPDDLVCVAGSTQAPEEEYVLSIFQKLRSTHPNLRLFLVPRQKDRFDEVARLLERSGVAFIRRSTIHPSVMSKPSHLILVDTIGELGALWGLADVAFVGGSMDGQRGGQNMIEPAAYGAAVVFGPHVWNFLDAATRLLEAGGACQIQGRSDLEEVLRRLLADPDERCRRGAAAQAFVRAQQGATERTLDLLDQLLARHGANRAAA